MTENRIGKSLAFLLALASPFAAAPAYAEPLKLAPHAARYLINGQDVRLPPEAGSFDGEFLLRLERKCSSWLLFVQMDMSLMGPQGIPADFQGISVTEEMDDGAGLRFRTQHRLNGQVVQEFSGEATEDKVAFKDPEEKNLDLPKGVLFPVEAMEKAFEAFNAGKNIYSYAYFDGSGMEIQRISDLITGLDKEDLPKVKGDVSLLEGKRVKIISTKYDYNTADSEPVTTSRVKLNAKGVMTELQMEGETQKFTAILKELEEVKLPDCG